MTDGNGNADARGRRPRLVLLVEPDYQRRIYAAQLAAELGFRVILAAEADTAISLVVEQADRLDAVLVNLPEALEGLRAAAERHRPTLPIIDGGNAEYSSEALSRLLGPGLKD